MKNLKDEQLKQAFKQNIYEALEKSKEPALTIIFKFLIQDEPKYKKIEKIENFVGLKYKDVSFIDIEKEIAIKIITNNFYYNYFTLIDKDIRKKEATIHGHGEYWGSETWTFTYMRVKE